MSLREGQPPLRPTFKLSLYVQLLHRRLYILFDFGRVLLQFEAHAKFWKASVPTVGGCVTTFENHIAPRGARRKLSVNSRVLRTGVSCPTRIAKEYHVNVLFA